MLEDELTDRPTGHPDKRRGSEGSYQTDKRDTEHMSDYSLPHVWTWGVNPRIDCIGLG